MKNSGNINFIFPQRTKGTRSGEGFGCRNKNMTTTFQTHKACEKNLAAEKYIRIFLGIEPKVNGSDFLIIHMLILFF